MRRVNNSTQNGFSLVELMVGVAVGFFVVLAASAIYLNTFSSSAVSMHQVRLNQSMRAIMDVMVFDIHRAGAWGGASSGVSNNPFTRRVGDGRTDTNVIADLYVNADGSCILYSYDVNQNDGVDVFDSTTNTSEFFGFRYNSTTQQIEVLDQTDPTKRVSNTADAIANCSANTINWQPVNLPNEILVTGLTFSTEGSQCLAFNPKTFSPSVATTFAQWQLIGANSVAACDTAVSGGGATVPAAPSGSFSPSTVTIASTLTGRAEVRQVVIALTATHARDATLTRTLTETVRVRNDRVI